MTMVGMVITLALSTGAIAKPRHQLSGLLEQGLSTPITNTIRSLQPRLSWKEANRHAWAIWREAERTGISWKIIVAVTMQESSFRLMRGDRTCGLNEYGLETCVYQAFGPMHVYWRYWKKALNLSAWRLLHDLEYQYRVGVTILNIQRKRYSRGGWQWVGAYNSVTPRYRQRYNKRIAHWLRRIDRSLRRQIAYVRKHKR